MRKIFAKEYFLYIIYEMYVTLKLDDNGCRIHSVSDDGNAWIVTNERYVVMPWKMVIRNGTNMTLAEAVDGILSHQKSEAKEHERRKREKEEIENKCKEYYMLGKKILRMSPPSIQRFNLEDTEKLVAIVVASEMTREYLIKQKILPDHINV